MSFSRKKRLRFLMVLVLFISRSIADTGKGIKESSEVKETIEFMDENGMTLQATTLKHTNTNIESYEMDSIEIRAEITKADKIKISEIQNFNMTLKFFFEELQLIMEENRVTLQSGVKLISYTENGTRIESEDDVEDCKFYQGAIMGEPFSLAAISICNNEMEGAVLSNDQRYVLRPTNRTGEVIKKEAGSFVFGPHSIIVYPAIEDGNNKYGFVRIAENSTHKQRERRDLLHLSETKYVELYIVNDRSEFLWLGSNTANNMRRMKQITNVMDSFYQPHNIRIVFRALEVWNDADKFTVQSSIENTLNSFLSYRRNNIMPRLYHDNAQLVSRIDFTGPTIGLAPLNGMCRIEHSGNVNQDTHSDFAYVAATMAHEIGHNLGMEHDASGCVCHGLYGVCLMSPYAQDPISMKFSECSRTYLENYLKQEIGGCLLNKPNTGNYFDEKLCGNNKLDPGEDCDCGYPAFCQNPCCDANTCKFTAGSECSTGGCCSGCKLKTAGTKCRETFDQCDIVETCDGISSECKENLYYPNGKPCNEFGQNGYCYEGYCRTFNGQCRRVWGGNAFGGDPACYSVLNVRGDQYGNCGTSGNYYVRCSQADVNCGKTFCDGMATGAFPVIGYNKARSSVSFVYGGRKVYCKSGMAKLGQNQPDPLLIGDGVQCATGMACLNRRCVSVSQITSSNSPCPGNCNGHGICSNKGICICDASWEAPSCQKEITSSPTAESPTILPKMPQHNNNNTNGTGMTSSAVRTSESHLLSMFFVGSILFVILQQLIIE